MTPAASGMKRMIERWIVISSRARDQEVEGHAADAHEQEQRVPTQVAGLDRARERGPGADDPGGAAHDHALHELGLDDRAPDVAERRGGPDEDGVVELVEVPLVQEEVV